MALNPSTNPVMTGRVTAADTDYPFGSAKNETAPGAGDGTPYFKARADDLFGFQQALLRSGGLTPSGNADTAPSSQYLQGVIQQVLGRGFLYSDTGVADAYIAERRTNQQVPAAVFEGMRFAIVPLNANTGAATVDISDLLNEAPGTTVVDVKLAGGVTDPNAGDIVAGQENYLIYRTSPGVHLELSRSDVTLATQAQAQAHTDNAAYMSALRTFEAFQQYGLGYSDGATYEETLDADNLVKGGFFYLTSTAANLPAAGNWLVTVSIGADANNVHQVAVSDTDGTLLYVRSRVAGVWESWASNAPLGSGQTWQDVSGSRTSGVTYTNTTGKAIYVAFFVDSGVANNISALIDGSVKLGFLLTNSPTNDVASLSFIVPAGQTYSITDNAPTNERLWYELR